MRCSLSLASTRARVSVRADERDVGLELEQVGHGADVVLVAVGQHDRLDVVEPVLDVLEVREDQVDAGVVVLGEEHAAVDDEQLALRLDDGHVAADLAETAEGDDAQAVGGERRAGRVSSGWGWLTVESPTALESPAGAGRATRGSVGGARPAGRRTAADVDDAELPERGLGHDRTLGDVHDGVDDRDEPPVHRDGGAQVAARRPRRPSRRTARPATWATTPTKPTAPLARWARLATSSPENQSRSVWAMTSRRGPQVALGVLDRGDPRVVGEAQERLGGDGDAGPAGDVVEHHRQVGGVRDGGEVRDEPSCGGLL